MAYWLMKSEPETYSIDDLEHEPGGAACWDGVRNYQARNFMRDDMKVGDLAFFYHSNCKVPGIAGVARVVKTGYPDHTAFDPESKYFDPKSNPDNPRWIMVDIHWVETFEQVVALSTLRETAGLEEMRILQKGNRLSITPVTAKEWKIINKLSK